MSSNIERAAEVIDHDAFNVDWSQAHDPRDREQGESRRRGALRVARALADAGLLATEQHDREVAARALDEVEAHTMCDSAARHRVAEGWPAIGSTVRTTRRVMDHPVGTLGHVVGWSPDEHGHDAAFVSFDGEVIRTGLHEFSILTRDDARDPHHYGSVWDDAVPPGGFVCNLCGMPTESEPCPDHAPQADSRTDVGLDRRYDVRRFNDPDGKHDSCRFFVLDPQHDEAAKVAIRAYADATSNAVLAQDLRKWGDEA